MTFARHVCWNPDDVQPAVAPDVAAAADAVLLATHRSLPIERQNAITFEAEDVVREQDVLASFLGARNDPMLMAVVGPAGSGKSHLIRWMHARLRSDPHYHVIHVPRQGTNLRAVIRNVLESLPGDDSSALLHRLEGAINQLNPELARAMLLDMLRRLAQFSRPAGATATQDAVWAELAPGLAALLGRSEYEEQLLADQGLLARLVGQLHGSMSATGSDRFGIADLRVSIEAPMTALGPDGHRTYVDIMRREDAAQAAADLLNEALPDAIGRVLGLENAVPVAQVMTESRELLHEQGLELVLLIEDLALYEHQIDRTLLEAMLVPAAAAEGERPRCVMRTAFAITDDPFARLRETVRTRLAAVYRTGASFGDEGSVGTAAAVEFVAGYLNAARLGADRLAREYRDADPDERDQGTWVPNSCSTCSHRPSCHDAEAGFGASGEKGYGLYPYNRASLTRVVGSTLRSGRFDPRAVASRIVGEVLANDAESIAEGRFPTRTFGRRFPVAPSQQPLSSEVRDVLERFPDAERRAELLTFWGDAPTEPANLGQFVHEAFDLAPVADFAVRAPEAAPAPSTPPVPAAPTRAGASPSTSIDDDLRAVDVWLGEEDAGLPGRIATTARERLFQLVMLRVNWPDHLVRRDIVTDVVFSAQSFMVEQATGRNPKASAVRIPIERTPENALVLKAVLRFDHEGHWEFADGARMLALLSAKLDEWAAMVVAAVHTYGQRRQPWSPMTSMARLLLLVARLTGDDEAWSDDPVGVARSLLAPASSHVPDRFGNDPWHRLVDYATSKRPELAAALLEWLQVAQGQGAALAVDLQALFPVIEGFDYRIEPVPPDAPDLLREVSKRLSTLFAPTLEAEAKRLLEATSGLGDLVHLDPVVVSSTLLESIRAARDAGVFEPSERFGAVQALCEGLATFDVTALQRLLQADGLRSVDPGEQLRAVLDLQGAAALAEQARRVILVAEEAVTESLRRAMSGLEHSPDIDRARDDVRRSIDLALGELGAMP